MQQEYDNVNQQSDFEEDDEIIEGQGTEPGEDEEEEENEGEEYVEQEEGEQEKNKKKDEISKVMLNKVRRENFRYLNEIQELQKQLVKERTDSAELKYLNDLSTQTALSHYEISAKEKLDRAKDMREAALESGDTKAISETDITLAKAVYEYEKLKGYQAEQSVSYENQQALERARNDAYQNDPYNQYPQKPPISEESYNQALDWADKNDWIRNESPNYDHNKRLIADQVCDNLDNYCYQNNMAHLIGSPQYFEALDQQINQYYQPQQQQQNQRGNMSNQKQQQRGNVSSRVAPARGRSAQSTPTGGSQRNLKPLSNTERDMIKRLGVDEQTYRSNKARSEKNDYIKDQVSQYRGF